MKFSVTNVLVVIAALFIGRCTADVPPPPVITNTVYDTVPPQALLDQIKAMQMKADGLQAKMARRERVLPETITVTDTLVSPPDTVLQALRFVGGQLTLAPLVHDSAALYRPEIHQFDVSDCDDGFSWASGELVCDKARFGHLSSFIAFGAVRRSGYLIDAAAGAFWKPSFRSPWSVGFQADATGRVEAGVVREFKIW